MRRPTPPNNQYKRRPIFREFLIQTRLLLHPIDQSNSINSSSNTTTNTAAAVNPSSNLTYNTILSQLFAYHIPLVLTLRFISVHINNYQDTDTDEIGTNNGANEFAVMALATSFIHVTLYTFIVSTCMKLEKLIRNELKEMSFTAIPSSTRSSTPISTRSLEERRDAQFDFFEDGDGGQGDDDDDDVEAAFLLDSHNGLMNTADSLTTSNGGTHNNTENNLLSPPPPPLSSTNFEKKPCGNDNASLNGNISDATLECILWNLWKAVATNLLAWLLMSSILLNGSKPILVYLGLDDYLAELTQIYLRILTPGFLAFSMQAPLTTYLLTNSITDIPLFSILISSLSVWPLNAFFTYICHFSIMNGSALSLSCAYIFHLMLLVYLVYTEGQSADKNSRIANSVAIQEEDQRTYSHSSAMALIPFLHPITQLQYLVWKGYSFSFLNPLYHHFQHSIQNNILHFCILLLVGRLSPSSSTPFALVSMFVYILVSDVCNLLPRGMGIITSHRITALLEQAEPHGAFVAARIAVTTSILATVILVLLIMFIPHSFFLSVFFLGSNHHHYHNTDDAEAAAEQQEHGLHDALVQIIIPTIPILASLLLANGVQYSIQGVLDGCNSSRMGLAIQFVCCWAFLGIPVAYYLAFLRHEGVVFCASSPHDFEDGSLEHTQQHGFCGVLGITTGLTVGALANALVLLCVATRIDWGEVSTKAQVQLMMERQAAQKKCLRRKLRLDETGNKDFGQFRLEQGAVEKSIPKKKKKKKKKKQTSEAKGGKKKRRDHNREKDAVDENANSRAESSSISKLPNKDSSGDARGTIPQRDRKTNNQKRVSTDKKHNAPPSIVFSLQGKPSKTSKTNSTTSAKSNDEKNIGDAANMEQRPSLMESCGDVEMISCEDTNIGNRTLTPQNTVDTSISQPQPQTNDDDTNTKEGSEVTTAASSFEGESSASGKISSSNQEEEVVVVDDEEEYSSSSSEDDELEKFAEHLQLGV